MNAILYCDKTLNRKAKVSLQEVQLIEGLRDRQKKTEAETDEDKETDSGPYRIYNEVDGFGDVFHRVDISGQFLR